MCGRSLQLSLSARESAKLDNYYLGVDCDFLFDHNHIIHGQLFLPIPNQQPCSISTDAVFRFCSNVHVNIHFNHIFHIAVQSLQAICNAQLISEVKANIFLISLVLMSWLLYRKSIPSRTIFLNRNNWNASDLNRRAISFRCVEFVARQHLVLTDIADQLNFCYSFQVKFLFHISFAHKYFYTKLASVELFRWWSMLESRLLRLWCHSSHFIDSTFIKMISTRNIHSIYFYGCGVTLLQLWWLFLPQVEWKMR